jgi:anaerobic ribonucleoside-triphosphate reductase activating protein
MQHTHESILNVHGVIPTTTANGPGNRVGIWVQGCSIQCRGCINPEAQPHEPRYLVPVKNLITLIASLEGIEGVTISGGEPFEQATSVADLLEGVLNIIGNQERLTTFVFTGYTYESLKASSDVSVKRLLGLIDILCSGPYIEEEKFETLLWRGSRNQELVYLTDRYNASQEKKWMDETPKDEMIIMNSNVLVTGFSGKGGIPMKETKNKRLELSGFLKKYFGIEPKTLDMYMIALTQSSHESGVNNERLAFLGDGVIKLYFRNKFYDENPENTGILTELTKEESNVILHSIGMEIGIVDYMIFGNTYTRLPQEKKEEVSIIATAMEAIIGAIYKEKGFKTACKAVENVWKWKPEKK